jgi:hypothetical protein
MGGSSSKNKGSAYERRVSSLFDKWYDVPSKTFWRSRVSGAWIEQGDLVSRDQSVTGKFPFIVECKFQKGLNLWAVVNNREKNWFTEFWKQLDEEVRADGKGKYGLLVFKTNRSPDYVSFDAERFEDVGSIEMEGAVAERSVLIDQKVIMLWSEFAKIFKPTMFTMPEKA